MNQRLSLRIILSFLLFVTCVRMEFVGPTGVSINEETTCEEFGRFARFNPYSVLKAKWFIFYYWGSKIYSSTFIFTIPSANETRNLHRILDNAVEKPVNWSARHVLMWDQRKSCNLLTERDDRGAYWLYQLPEEVYKGLTIPAKDIRLKQIGDNLYIGLMFCKEYDVYALSKLNCVPKKSYLQDAAARIGYRGRRGKSYLYQGHEWMPIPEGSEHDYWSRPKFNRIRHILP